MACSVWASKKLCIEILRSGPTEVLYGDFWMWWRLCVCVCLWFSESEIIFTLLNICMYIYIYIYCAVPVITYNVEIKFNHMMGRCWFSHDKLSIACLNTWKNVHNTINHEVWTQPWLNVSNLQQKVWFPVSFYTIQILFHRNSAMRCSCEIEFALCKVITVLVE